MACFEQALRFQADLPQVHYYLGHALLGRGLLAEAVAHFHQLPPLPHVEEREHGTGSAMTAAATAPASTPKPTITWPSR